MKRILFSVAAAALAGAALPVTAPAGNAAEDGYSGYRSIAIAAPVKVELYEPTIPIPSSPQLEFELGYTKVEADSGSSLGRASWLWPGDPVGEGMKTFVEQLGLPEQLGENGYPVQVNSGQPSGEEQQADEPFPGMVMRTSASDTKTIAQAGFSPDGQVGDGTESDEGSAEETPNPLEQFGQAITGGLTTAAEDEPAPGGAPGLPPEVAALVDLEGYTSTSQNVVTDGKVVTTARSALGSVSLLGGVITLDGIVSTSVSSSDGAKGATQGRTVLGGMTVAGQEFSFGPDGFVAAGQGGEVPPLPAEVTDALAQLGISLELTKPERKVKGDQATSAVSGLVVDLDTSVLRKQLDALPLDDLIGALPSDPPELKSTLQSVLGLSPRVVVTLGVASTQVDTVQGLDIPTDVPDNDPGTTDADGGAGGTGTSPSSGAAPSAGAPAASPPGDAAAAAGDLPPAELTGSGLPPLYSIPGAILVGGIALAAVGGSWLRKAGVLALGGAGSCTHGLDSGLPDLRKA